MDEDNILRVMGMGRPNLFGNINQLYDQMLRGQNFMSNPGSIYQQGMQAAQGIPNQLMNAFGFVNQLNSANMQNIHQQNAKIAQANAEATAQIEAERLRQQGANERVRTVSPLLQGLFSGVGSSGLGSVTTNYGAGINPTQGSAAQATDTAGFRSRGAGIKKK